MTHATQLAMDLTERGWIPEPLVRGGIRRLIRSRLRDIGAGDCEQMIEETRDFVAAMNQSCIAPLPDKANEQHYEIPPEFFRLVLGSNRKYSSCYWPAGVDSLDQAEEQALALTCERAGLVNGQRILELGCGWGSLTLWMATRYPNSQIVAVSNSAPQRKFIEAEAKRGGLSNLQIVTADMNEFSTFEQFDRVVSVEMFEHMRNYRSLFRRVHDWLDADGQFFMHIFCHRAAVYEFTVRDETDWMSQYFFSGGIMPSEDLPLRFQDDLKLEDMWRWNGKHYARTANAWLDNMTRNRSRIMPILIDTYGEDEAHQWWMRWRVFFMACAELFGFDEGQQWWVAHYLFKV